MGAYRQIARDYGKDHGKSEEEVIDSIKTGELDGTEEDGKWYVRFEQEEEKKPQMEPKKSASTAKDREPSSQRSGNDVQEFERRCHEMSAKQLHGLLNDFALSKEEEEICRREIRSKEAIQGQETAAQVNTGTKRIGGEDRMDGRVVVTNIKMPFVSLVGFMVKAAIAAIPAFVILAIIGMIVFYVLSGMVTGRF